jgi:predicted ATPase
LTDSRQRGLDAFLRAVTLVREKVESFERYPFSIPAIRARES